MVFANVCDHFILDHPSKDLAGVRIAEITSTAVARLLAELSLWCHHRAWFARGMLAFCRDNCPAAYPEIASFFCLADVNAACRRICTSPEELLCLRSCLEEESQRHLENAKVHQSPTCFVIQVLVRWAHFGKSLPSQSCASSWRLGWKTEEPALISRSTSCAWHDVQSARGWCRSQCGLYHYDIASVVNNIYWYSPPLRLGGWEQSLDDACFVEASQLRRQDFLKPIRTTAMLLVKFFCGKRAMK